MGGGSFACRSALLVHEADERVCPPMKPTAVALAPVLMLGIGLAACSTPESKVRSRLIEVGVSPPMAGCMAERVVDRLSYAQLRRLGELGRIDRKSVVSGKSVSGRVDLGCRRIIKKQ